MKKKAKRGCLYQNRNSFIPHPSISFLSDMCLDESGGTMLTKVCVHKNVGIGL